jgi:hypothetical protein
MFRSNLLNPAFGSRLLGSYVVREIHITDGIVTRVAYDVFASVDDATKDARERQDRLVGVGMTFDVGPEGIVLTNDEYPDDHIIIGVTVRNIERLI